MCIYDRHQEEKEKREKVREITQGEWEKLIERINELEERVGHSELAIERLEHSEDKEYLESIENCKGCRKLGINDKECRNYNNCKTKKFYEDIVEKDLEDDCYDDEIPNVIPNYSYKNVKANIKGNKQEERQSIYMENESKVNIERIKKVWIVVDREEDIIISIHKTEINALRKLNAISGHIVVEEYNLEE